MRRTMSELLREPLMIDPRYQSQLVEQSHQELRMIGAGDSFDFDKEPLLDVALIDSDTAMRLDSSSSSKSSGNVIAVVPLSGVVTRHGYMSLFSSAPGSLEIGRKLQELDADPAVGSIVLSVDSPGGSVYGTPELSRLLFDITEARRTRTVAVVDPLMASAATYIATAADEVFAIPSADVGSVGVIWSYADYSQQLENEGVSVEVLRVPDKKARFSGVEPMTDDMRSTAMNSINDSYEQFVADLARNRGVTEKHVTRHFGGGEVMSAQEGVDVGMIDGLASLDETINMLIRDQQAKGKDRKRYNADRRARELQLKALEK